MPPNTFAQRLFSLSGLVPLAAFVILHVAEQFRAVFAGTRPALGDLGGSAPARLLLLWAPLAFHALYGLRLCFKPIETFGAGSALVTKSRLLGGIGRVTGLIALVFIVLHARGFSGATPFERLGGADRSNELYATLSSTLFGLPLVAAGYVSGLLAVGFHLAYGCYTAALRFGYARSPSGARRLLQLVTLATLGWLALGIGTVVKTATGTVLPF